MTHGNRFWIWIKCCLFAEQSCWESWLRKRWKKEKKNVWSIIFVCCKSLEDFIFCPWEMEWINRTRTSCNKTPGIVQIFIYRKLGCYNQALFIILLYLSTSNSDNVQVVKEESPWLRKLTGQANPQKDSDNKEGAQFVYKINTSAQQKWVFKWVKWQNWLKLENKLCGHNQDESSTQTLSNLPVRSAPFSPKIFSPNSLHYNLVNTTKANRAIILW